MRNARLLIGLLICATVLVDLVAVSVGLAYLGSQSPSRFVIFTILFLLAISQVNLLAVWIGFGGRSLIWRLVALVLAIVSWSTALGILCSPAPPPSAEAYRSLIIVHLLKAAVPIFSILWIARLGGMKLVRTNDVSATGRAVSGRTRFQFSLGSLLSWITAAAIALGLFQYSVTNYEILRPLADMSIAIWLLENAAFVLLALWTALGSRRLLLRLLVTAVAVSVAVVTRCALIEDEGDRISRIAITIGVFLWQLGFLCVLRVAGYRLVGRAWAGTSEPTCVGEDS
ncbi:MAG: hypothetical protein HQ582_28990 [Planctomycetes bacterium]|nr:hypothetical protein [Planctomycetota bacterium]